MDELAKVEQRIEKAEVDLKEAQAELKTAKQANDAGEISFWKQIMDKRHTTLILLLEEKKAVREATGNPVGMMRAAATEAPPQVETAYRKYELVTDELGLKSKVVKLMYTRTLKGSVERKQVSDAPQFFCEILVYGKIERILKFEKSLRALFPGVALRCTVLRREEFVELDEGVLAKLVKTDAAFHREDSSGGTNELFRGQRDIERLDGEASWWDNVSVTTSAKSLVGGFFGYESAQGMLRDVVKEHTGVGGNQKRLKVTIGSKTPVLMRINADTSTWEFLLEKTGKAVSSVVVMFDDGPVEVENPTLLENDDHIVVRCD